MGQESVREHFIVHDGTGECTVRWSSEVGFLKPIHTFDEAQQQEGLQDDDRVYDVLLLYLIKVGTPYIVQVRKRYSTVKSKKTLATQEIKSLLPVLKPEPA